MRGVGGLEWVRIIFNSFILYSIDKCHFVSSQDDLFLQTRHINYFSNLFSKHSSQPCIVTLSS